MNLKPVLLIISIIGGLLPGKSLGQFKTEFSRISIAATNIHYGLPFYKMFPIHPGVEIDVTVLQKEKENISQSILGSVGYFYHDKVSSGFYFSGNYRYQVSVKKSFGVDFSTGIGYVYSLFPSQSYQYNSSEGVWQPNRKGKSFAQVGLGVGVTYIKPKVIHPFIRYDFNYLNFWEFNFYLRSTAILKAGISINLNLRNE